MSPAPWPRSRPIYRPPAPPPEFEEPFMRQWTIDAFASAPFKGNPACVVEPFDRWPSDAWMQALAAENNQAETAFLLKTADPARYG
ncbi:PhzF family phenazine biosynthesis protein, partial [Bacillus sp. YAF8]|uniref:PhzF family phenazine biosynthesis protein n=1 Tax=Bacillus sp. YAF8 TaxID=3237485 RepID=UPI003F8EB44C